MCNPNAQLKPNAQRRHRLTAGAAIVTSLAAATGAISLQIGPAIASTQPFSTENPFETDIPSAINSSGSVNGIDVGEPSIGSIGDIIPTFPGLPNSGFPETPGDVSSTVRDILNGGISGAAGDVIGGGGAIPKIFKDILSGNMGGILDSILGVLTSQNEIFGEVSKIVLGEGWEGADGDGNADTPPDPYKVRMLQEEKTDEATGLITRSPIVLRRDKANQYDQELSRAMAAPMLAEKGEEWLNTNIQTSSEMMQAGLSGTQSAINKAAEATEATSTQEIVRRSAEISGVAATLQMQEMQQNAMLGESLWNIQRLSSAQLQLAANASEAADEQNRRDRANRSASLTSSAAESMIIPGLADLSSGAVSPSSTAPKAPSMFAKP